MQAAPNTDPALEPELTALRRGVLNAASAGQSDGDLALACALAQQCFLNEYVFDVSAGEREQAEGLRQHIGEDLASGRDIPAFAVAALACYAPLNLLPGKEELAARTWPALLVPVIAQQIRSQRAST